MASIGVEILSREFVTQCVSPTPYTQFELKFSGLDQIYGTTTNPHHPPLVFFYENNPLSNIEKSVISKQLKESLYHTLQKFYPFGGKINGDSSVICNDSGALYLVARVDTTLLDTVQKHHLHNDIDKYLPLGRSTISYITQQFVPLAVQLTFFKCGGFAIGFNYSHKIADSWTFSMFLSSLAATCRGGDQTHRVFTPEFGLGYDLFHHIQDPQLLRELRVTNEEGINISKNKMVMKRFEFKNQEIMNLKKLAEAAAASRKNPSPVELVSAYIWKQIIEMKKLKSGNGTRTKFVANIEVNLREQHGSLIGDNAMGNFMVSKPVSLFDMITDYGFLVVEFQEAYKKKKMDSVMRFDCVRHCNDLIEAVKKPEVWSCNFSSLCGFPMYDDVDFGWGKPLLICPKALKMATVIIGRDRNGDGIEAWINLSEDDMDILSPKFASQMNSSSQHFTSSRL